MEKVDLVIELSGKIKAGEVKIEQIRAEIAGFREKLQRLISPKSNGVKPFVRQPDSIAGRLARLVTGRIDHTWTVQELLETMKQQNPDANPVTVRTTIVRLASEGRLRRVGKGKFRAPRETSEQKQEETSA